MDPNKLTLKSQTALDGARRLAVGRANQAIEDQVDTAEVAAGDRVLVDVEGEGLTFRVECR